MFTSTSAIIAPHPKTQYHWKPPPLVRSPSSIALLETNQIAPELSNLAALAIVRQDYEHQAEAGSLALSPGDAMSGPAPLPDRQRHASLAACAATTSSSTPTSAAGARDGRLTPLPGQLGARLRRHLRH